MSDQSVSPDLNERLAALLADWAEQLYTVTVGRVKSYDTVTQLADVELSIKIGYRDEFGDRKVSLQPVVTDVPVQQLGHGRVAFNVELVAGDPVVLLFSRDALDKWIKVAGTQPIDPGDDRRFSLTDAIALPGVRNLNEKLARGSGNWIGNTSGPAYIEFKSDDTIEAGGADALSFHDELKTLRNELHKHAHECPNTGTGTVPVSNGPSLTDPTGTITLKGG